MVGRAGSTVVIGLDLALNTGTNLHVVTNLNLEFTFISSELQALCMREAAIGSYFV